MKYVAAAMTTTQHKQMQLPTNPAWYSGPEEAPKISGPITLPTQYPTNVVALIVAFSVYNEHDLKFNPAWGLTGMSGYI